MPKTVKPPKPTRGWRWTRYRCTCGQEVPHNLRQVHAARHVDIEDRVGDWWQDFFTVLKPEEERISENGSRTRC